MNNQIAIDVKNLTKIYHLYDKPQDRLKEALHPFNKSYHHDFHALNNVSFQINKGDTVGIVGKNGAGKSTLLKMITGVLTPSSGILEVHGKIASLLELGAGFNPEMTGIENIYLNGTLMGFKKEEMDLKIAAILDFADIGEFIYQPVKMYSSGMFARLAFSVAINIEPEILIVDEVLSVGDMNFQAKSITKMKSMIEEKNTTVLFVSHDTGAVKSICDKAIYIDQGELINYASSDVIIEQYFKDMVAKTQKVEKNPADKFKQDIPIKDTLVKKDLGFEKRASFQRIQNGKAHFLNIQLLNAQGEISTNFEFGEAVTLRMIIQSDNTLTSLGYGYHIRDSNGVDIIYSDSYIEKSTLYNILENQIYSLQWEFKLNLSEGSYNIASVLSLPLDLDTGQVEFCDFIPLSVQFHMLAKPSNKIYGKVYWNNTVKVEHID